MEYVIYVYHPNEKMRVYATVEFELDGKKAMFGKRFELPREGVSAKELIRIQSEAVNACVCSLRTYHENANYRVEYKLKECLEDAKTGSIN